MAMFHLKATDPVARSKGWSACGAWGYVAAAEVQDPRTHEVYSFKNRHGVLAAWTVLPGGKILEDPGKFWGDVELHHKRNDATTARRFHVTLPHELSPEEQMRLAQAAALEVANEYGVAVGIALHAPDFEGDDRNFHAHFLLSACSCSRDGKLGSKVVELDQTHCRFNKIENFVEKYRPRWSAIVNERLEANGIDERIDHRSLEERGIDRPAMNKSRADIELDRKVMRAERKVLDLTNRRAVERTESDRSAGQDFVRWQIDSAHEQIVVPQELMQEKTHGFTTHRFDDTRGIAEQQDIVRARRGSTHCLRALQEQRLAAIAATRKPTRGHRDDAHLLSTDIHVGRGIPGVLRRPVLSNLQQLPGASIMDEEIKTREQLQGIYDDSQQRLPLYREFQQQRAVDPEGQPNDFWLWLLRKHKLATAEDEAAEQNRMRRQKRSKDQAASREEQAERKRARDRFTRVQVEQIEANASKARLQNRLVVNASPARQLPQSHVAVHSPSDTDRIERYDVFDEAGKLIASVVASRHRFEVEFDDPEIGAALALDHIREHGWKESYVDGHPDFRLAVARMAGEQDPPLPVFDGVNGDPLNDTALALVERRKARETITRDSVRQALEESPPVPTGGSPTDWPRFSDWWARVVERIKDIFAERSKAIRPSQRQTIDPVLVDRDMSAATLEAGQPFGHVQGAVQLHSLSDDRTSVEYLAQTVGAESIAREFRSLAIGVPPYDALAQIWLDRLQEQEDAEAELEEEHQFDRPRF